MCECIAELWEFFKSDNIGTDEFEKIIDHMDLDHNGTVSSHQ
jgi:hypothetical protein